MKKLIFILLTFTLFSCTSLLKDFGQPVLSYHYPGNGEKIAKDASFIMEFSETMDTQITERSFSVADNGGSSVYGRFHWESGNKRFTFVPYALLEANKKYSIKISKSAEDKQGNDLDKDYMISFYVVGDENDRPQLLSYTPAHLATGVSKDTYIELEFSKSIDPTSIGTGISVPFEYTPMWSNNYSHLSIRPKDPLTHGTTYKISLNENVKDTLGNKLYENIEFCFTVGENFAKPHITYLALIRKSDMAERKLYDISDGTNWADNTYSFDDKDSANLRPSIIIHFDKEMNRNVFYSEFSFAVAYQIEWLSQTEVRVDLLEDLKHGEVYNINLTSKLEDIQENTLYKDYVYQFRMGADMTPLRIIQLQIEGRDLIAEGISEINTVNPTERRPAFRLKFNQGVDISSFNTNYPLTTGLSSVNWLDEDGDGEYETANILFYKDLEWHKRYEIQFNSEILSSSRNPMEEKSFAFNLGSDYSNPRIRNDQLISTKTSINLIKKSLLTDYNHLIAKNDYIQITFEDQNGILEEMDMATLQNEIELVNVVSDTNKVAVPFSVYKASTGIYEIQPLSSFESSAIYQLILNNVRDIQGNLLEDSDRTIYEFIVDAENSRALEVTPISKDGSEASQVLLWDDSDSANQKWIPFINYTTSLRFPCDNWQGQLLIHFNNKIDYYWFKQYISVTALGDSQNSMSIPWDQIEMIEESDGSMSVIIKKLEDFTQEYSLYLLTIKGGANGVRDINGNTMKEDFKIYFKVFNES